MASGECEDRAGLHGRRTVGMSLLLLQPELCLYDELPVDEHAQELDHIVPKRPQRMRARARAWRCCAWTEGAPHSTASGCSRYVFALRGEPQL